MKQLQYIIIAMVVFSCQNIVHSQVPKSVKNAFEVKYPGENDPEWETDAHGNFEAHFKDKGVKYRADFSPNGHWIETENSIKKGDLPKAIRAIIKTEYGSEDITEVEHVQSASKGEFYDVEFKQKGKNKDIEFRANGDIIN